MPPRRSALVSSAGASLDGLRAICRRAVAVAKAAAPRLALMREAGEKHILVQVPPALLVEALLGVLPLPPRHGRISEVAVPRFDEASTRLAHEDAGKITWIVFDQQLTSSPNLSGQGV